MKKIVLLLSPFLIPLMLFAQSRKITGTVTDKNSRAALQGASLKSPSAAGYSGTDGSFSLNAVPGETITVSHVGFITQNIRVDNNPGALSIEMTPVDTAMETVVVTGYTSERKKDLIGAISVVNMNEVKNIPAASPLQSLQGRVPGMNITKDGTPGGGAKSVLIRGINTLGNNDPLYVIDGQPVDSKVMDRLDPNDIESLQVLKDAASASIYGSRASNGVIIITTKKGKTGKLRVDLNSSYATQDYATHLKMLNTDQRGRALWQAAINDGTDPNVNTQYQYQWHKDAQGAAVLDKVTVNEYLDKTIQGGIKSGNTDWFSEISRPGNFLRNNVSLSTGNETQSLFISAGEVGNKGIVKFTDYDQLTLRINSSVTGLKGRLKAGENIQLANTVQTPIGNGQGGTPLDLGILDLPILPVYAQDGSFAGPVGSGFSNRMNALQVSVLSKDWRNRTKGIYGTVYVEYSPLKNLTLKSSVGFDYSNTQEIRINPKYSAGFLSSAVNNYSNNNLQNTNLTWFNTLNYSLKKGLHTANILIGTEAIKNNSEFLNGYKEGFLLETPDYFQINAGTGLTSLTGSATGYKLLSYFSKINYSYNSKYLASVTLRSDGSSRFGENNKYGFFPALSVGWRISDENFVKDNIRFLSQMMLRAGFGRTGNQKIADDATFGLYIPGYGLTSTTRRNMGSAYDLGGANSGTLPSGVIPTQTANPELRWESTDEINIGTDLSFLQQRLTASVDYFFRKTQNILIKPPYLAVLGAGGSEWQNGATMQNKGWELAAGYNNQSKDFSYRFTGSIGSFKDKVTYLPASVVRAYPGNVEKTIIGHSLSSMFGYVTDGIFQNSAEVAASPAQPGKGVGRLRYKDLNGDKVVDVLDQDWLGNSIPDFEYGLNTMLGYKAFRLTFFFQGVQGIKNYNAVKNQAAFVGAFAGQNNSTLVLDAWTPQHTNTNIPAVSNFDQNNEVRMSTFQVENASYLKLRNVQLGYTIPKKIQEKLRMSRAEVYVSGSELLTVKSSGFSSPDPENAGTFYPIPRSFTLGLSVSF